MFPPMQPIFSLFLLLIIFLASSTFATRCAYTFDLACRDPQDVARVEFHKLGYQNRSAYYGEFGLNRGRTRFTAIFDVFNYAGGRDAVFDIRGSLQYNCGGAKAVVGLTSTVPVDLRHYSHRMDLHA